MLVNKTITTVKIRPLMTVPVNESSGFPIILPLSPELIVKPKGFTPAILIPNSRISIHNQKIIW
jgi:hypothetical protein